MKIIVIKFILFYNYFILKICWSCKLDTVSAVINYQFNKYNESYGCVA